MQTFDKYLESVLYLVANNYDRKFNSTDVKEFLETDKKFEADLDDLYHKKFSAAWRWNAFNDRLHRHIARVVKNCGGRIGKEKGRVIYNLPKIDKTNHSFLYEPKRYKGVSFSK